MDNFTKHADLRHRQRGFRDRDIDLILQYGTATSDGVILTNQDVLRRQQELKQEASALDRLAGAYTVIQSGKVITTYRPTKRIRRRLKVI